MEARKPHRQLPMTKRIIYIPLVAIAFGFLVIGYFASFAARTSLLEQMNHHATNLSEQMAARINDHQSALKTIEELLDEKIAIIGTSISAQQLSFNGQDLQSFSKRYKLIEINWFSKDGIILASSIPEYEGWIAPEEHPVRGFISTNGKVWSEPIRKDAESDRYNKYGYYRLNDGTILQIALPADGVQKLTDQFAEAFLMKVLSEYDGVVHAAYINKEFKCVTFSQSNNYNGDTKILNLAPEKPIDQEAIELLTKGQMVTREPIPGSVYEVFIPVTNQNSHSGYLNIAFDMSGVIHTINKTSLRVFFIGLVTLLLITIIMELLLKRYVARPIEDLSTDMLQIHLENNTTYRLPNRETDPFVGLRQIMNQVLDITHQYFDEIIAHQEELIATNDELEASNGQLSASEEELRAQYDEIEAYAHHMAQLKQRFSIAIEATGCYIWEFNGMTGELAISDHLMTFLGLSSDTLMLKDFVRDYVHMEDQNNVYQSLIHKSASSMTGDDGLHIQMRMKGTEGGWLWYFLRGSLTGEHLVAGPQLTGVIVDMNQQKEQEHYIQYIADHDPLTGLYSRRKFQEFMAKAIESGKTGTVLLMDIDNFKNINDYYGHIYGDKVLKHFANLLKSHMLENSSVYRLGGDEFIVHVDGARPLEEVLINLKDFAGCCIEQQVIDGLEQRLTVSTGIARYPIDADRVEELLMKADLAMYQSKKSGKNQHSCYNVGLKEVLSHRLNVENHLRQALSDDGFVMHYQPVIDAKTLKIVCFEALIRLKDNAYSPTDLIAIAEESGLIHAIGRWVIKEVIEQQARWRKNGLSIKPVAVNISPRQMIDAHLVTYIGQLLERHQLEPHYFEVEITENILVENRQENLVMLDAMRKLGLKIALDDFGTGYSSLNYLTFIPVDKIKLDKSLKDKFIDLESIQVMDSLISLAHGLQLKVVAEGVETEMESQRLIHGNCDYLQGYYFSCSLSAEKAEAWLLEHSASRLTDAEEFESIQII